MERAVERRDIAVCQVENAADADIDAVLSIGRAVHYQRDIVERQLAASRDVQVAVQQDGRVVDIIANLVDQPVPARRRRSVRTKGE